jgi:hypothetical protein
MSEDLLGRTVLVGITCVDAEGDVVAKIQAHGKVQELRDDVILLARDDGTFGLPPARDLLEPAEPGIYTLRATGESVEDPDFLLTLTVTVDDQGSVEEIEQHGFQP